MNGLSDLPGSVPHAVPSPFRIEVCQMSGKCKGNPIMSEQRADGELSGDALLTRRKRALYRAQYRGTKEMDWMVGRYAAAKLDDMSVPQLETFESFLELGDPEINAWLMTDVTCREPQFVALVEDIRAFHDVASSN